MHEEKIRLMKEGGHKLAVIRDQLAAMVKPGLTLLDLENTANELISQTGGEAAFKHVPGYRWATCINVNEGLVHGIPTTRVILDGDLVSIDLGLYYKGYYTDTSTSVVSGTASPLQAKLLEVGRQALKAGIKAAKAGRRVSDISSAVQKVVENAGLVVVRDLTGHGVGKELHEDPYVPNFVFPGDTGPVLYEGQTLAIEPIYSISSPHIKTDKDGWTITTTDGSLGALVEETIVVTSRGGVVLTK